jgi:hypothetical protein
MTGLHSHDDPSGMLVKALIVSVCTNLYLVYISRLVIPTHLLLVSFNSCHGLN